MPTSTAGSCTAAACAEEKGHDAKQQMAVKEQLDRYSRSRRKCYSYSHSHSHSHSYSYSHASLQPLGAAQPARFVDCACVPRRMCPRGCAVGLNENAPAATKWDVSML